MIACSWLVAIIKVAVTIILQLICLLLKSKDTLTLRDTTRVLFLQQHGLDVGQKLFQCLQETFCLTMLGRGNKLGSKRVSRLKLVLYSHNLPRFDLL